MDAPYKNVGSIFYEITVPVIFIMWLRAEVLRLNISGDAPFNSISFGIFYRSD
jgi:hypothetical protein